ncbi:MAG: tetratricopeptide repeat protein [candidate division Zixibacteria bacterium]|nr:tetratricopeptide repeat protein [candidate division Zixibacteria bacterium]
MARKKTKKTAGRDKAKTDYIPFIIFGIALILRLIYLFQSRANDPQFYIPVMDPLFHHQWAQRIAGGDVWGDGAFFRAPLYPYFLALIYKIFGVDIFAAKLIQMILGSFTAALTYLAGKRVFGKIPGLIGGLLFALFAPSIFYEGEFLLDPLATFLVMVSTLATLSAAGSGKKYLFLPVGMLWGLGAICRPTVLSMIAVVVIIIIIFHKAVDKKGRIARTAMIIAGSLIMILPITVWNYILEDDFILIASQGGVNFYIGNNMYADGVTATIPELPSWAYRDAVALAENDVGRDLKPSGISSYYFGRGLEFWGEAPFEALKITIKKAVVFFSDEEIANNRGFYFAQMFSPVLKYIPVTFALIGPLSLLGIGLITLIPAWRRFDVYILIGLIVAHWGSHIPFFVNGRFRLPIIPLLAVFAGAAVYYVYKWLRKKELKRIGWTAVILAVSCVIVFIDIKGQINDEIAEGWNILGLNYLDQGNLVKAEDAFLKAIERDPGALMINLNLASIAFYKNDMEMAEKYLLAELRLNPYEIRALNNLSMLKRMQGNLQAAIEYARRAVEAQPAHEEPYINLVVSLRARGESAKSREIINETLNKYPYFYNLKLISGDYYLEDGDTTRAVEQYRQILSARDELMIKYADVKGVGEAPPGARLRQVKSEAQNRLKRLGYIANK